MGTSWTSHLSTVIKTLRDQHQSWKLRPPAPRSTVVTQAGEFFLAWEGIILVACVGYALVRLSASTYADEREYELSRRDELLEFYEQQCRLSATKLQSIQSSHSFWRHAEQASEERAQRWQLRQQVNELKHQLDTAKRQRWRWRLGWGPMQPTTSGEAAGEAATPASPFAVAAEECGQSAQHWRSWQQECAGRCAKLACENDAELKVLFQYEMMYKQWDDYKGRTLAMDVSVDVPQWSLGLAGAWSRLSTLLTGSSSSSSSAPEGGHSPRELLGRAGDNNSASSSRRSTTTAPEGGDSPRELQEHITSSRRGGPTRDQGSRRRSQQEEASRDTNEVPGQSEAARSSRGDDAGAAGHSHREVTGAMSGIPVVEQPEAAGSSRGADAGCTWDACVAGVSGSSTASRRVQCDGSSSGRGREGYGAVASHDVVVQEEIPGRGKWLLQARVWLPEWRASDADEEELLHFTSLTSWVGDWGL